MSTTTLALHHRRDERMAEIFHTALSGVISHADAAAAEARKYRTVRRWRRHLRRRISAAAVGTSFIPHGTGIVLELPYLLRLMGRGAIGIGALSGATVDADTDLPAIYAVWSGAISKTALAAAEGGVVVVNSIAYPAFGAKVLALGFKLGVKAAASGLVGGAAGTAISTAAGPAGSMLQPVLGKVIAKVSAKIAAKVGVKALTNLVLVYGTAASVGISLYILNEFLADADRYYAHKLADMRAR